MSGMVIGILLFVVMFAGMIALIHKSATQKSAAQENAKIAYRNALLKLKNNPTNADLRQNALNLGRIYSNLCRDEKGVTIFDEMALMNDINAVCAGASVTTAPPEAKSAVPPPPPAVLSIEERLSKLSDLKAKGLINENEFETRKKELLSEL